jgi:hypothetical protein
MSTPCALWFAALSFIESVLYLNRELIMTITATQALLIEESYRDLIKQPGVTREAAQNQLGLIQGTQLHDIVTNRLTASIYRAISEKSRERIQVSIS